MTPTRPKNWMTAVAIVVMLITTALLARFSKGGKLESPGVTLIEVDDVDRLEVLMPDELPGGTLTRIPVHEDELSVLPQDTAFGKRSYLGKDGFQAFVNVVVMGTDRTSIHKPQYCLTGQGWAITSVQYDTIPISPMDYVLPVKMLTLSRTVTNERGEQVTISGYYAYWFFEEEKITTSDLGRVTSIAGTLITHGKLERWAYTGCLTACRVEDEEVTYEKLKSFIAELVPEFQNATGKPQG